MNAKVLVLAGTTEATELAGLLEADGIDVIIAAPADDDFGPDVQDHAAHLRDTGIAAIVDGRDPFARTVSLDEVATTASTAGVPYVRLLREPWRPQPGDRWIDVPDLQAAAAAVDEPGRRVFLAIDSTDLAAFAGCTRPWFLIRSVDPVTTIANVMSIRDPGPFNIERELELLGEHFIDTVVARNDGGQATIAKLEAARSLGLTVVMVQRPLDPTGARVLSSAQEAVAWVRAQLDESAI